MKKTIKIIFIVSTALSVLFISLYFILEHQAALCDPVWEIKRHDALIKAANNFLYAFVPMLIIAAAMGGTLPVLARKNDKNKVDARKAPDKIKSGIVEKIMAENNISFFDAVWQYFLSVGAIERFKEAYVSQLQRLNVDRETEEANLSLTEKQKEIVKSELKNKIVGIKNGEYDGIFESVFKDEVKAEIEMSGDDSLGGLSPDEYLHLLFESLDGAMFFFDFSVRMENDIPIVTLDIDDGGIDWQPFD